MSNVKDKIFPVEIIDIDTRCRGVARMDDGRVIFVPYVMPGEKVSISIVSEKKHYAEGKLNKIITKSPCRIEPICAVYGSCGGCAIQHIEYSEQLAYKTKLILMQLKKLAGILDADVLPCRPSLDIYNYRNKASFRFEHKNGQVEMGFFEEESHNIIPTEYCHISSDSINKAAAIVREFIVKDNITVFSKMIKKPYLRSVAIRKLNGNILLNFSASQYFCMNVDRLSEELGRQFDDYGIYISVDKAEEKAGKPKLVGGKDKIGGIMSGINFEISPESFLQINSAEAEILYADAIKFANISGDDIVVDAYSGIGILSVLLARNAHHVYSIEIVAKATEDARRIAKRNGINNITVLTGDCSVILSDLLKNIRTLQPNKQLTVVLDPARKGCSQAVLEALLTASPDKIIYISCDSATLCRDLKSLNSDYEIKIVIPYDMFPQTCDIETLVYLERREC